MDKTKRLVYCFLFVVITLVLMLPFVFAVTTITGNSAGTLCANTISTSGDYELGSDLKCGVDPVIIITAPNVNLDCKGYEIVGSGQSSTYGVQIKSTNTVTVKNCNITNFDYNIYLENSQDLTLKNNSLTNAINYGIYVENGLENILLDNYFFQNTVAGVKLYSTSANQIKENYFFEDAIGFFVESSSENEFLENEVLDSTGQGVFLTSGGTTDYSESNVFKNNVICDTASSGDDFYCEAKSSASGAGNYFESVVTCDNGYPDSSTDYTLCTEDSDGDGLRDFEDNCPSISNSDQSDVDGNGVGDLCDSESDDTSCSDGFDNDGDGNMDCADSDCDGSVGGLSGELCEYALESTCNDGFDNDASSSEDCYDINCDGVEGGSSGELCEYGFELSCTDGFDNDGNGVIDLDEGSGICEACSDTDGGYDTLNVGTVTGTSYLDEQIDSSSGWTDFCQGEQLVEYWCPSAGEISYEGEDIAGYAYGAVVDCDTGYSCSDGVCVEDASCSNDYSLCTESECGTSADVGGGDGIWYSTGGICLDPSEDYDEDCIVNGDENNACLDSDVETLSSCLSTTFYVYSDSNDAVGCVFGDLDTDNDVDEDDLDLFKTAFAESYRDTIIASSATYHAADLNEDGKLTFADVLLFVESYVGATSGVE